MTQRTLIKDLAASIDGPVSVSGWVEVVRDQKKVQFVVLRDESGAVQLVNPRGEESTSVSDTISGLSQGSFLTATGDLKHDERVKLGGVEIKLEALNVASLAIAETPIADDSGVDKRMDWRFLDLRVPRNALIFKIQTTFEHALRTWWIDRDFIELHTPKLMASASESRAELDRFCDAMIAIRGEIDAVGAGRWPLAESPLRGAPHTAQSLPVDEWSEPYSRELAAYPLATLRGAKYWPPVRRIDNAHGDRNLMCTCPPPATYET